MTAHAPASSRAAAGVASARPSADASASAPPAGSKVQPARPSATRRTYAGHADIAGLEQLPHLSVLNVSGLHNNPGIGCSIPTDHFLDAGGRRIARHDEPCARICHLAEAVQHEVDLLVPAESAEGEEHGLVAGRARRGIRRRKWPVRHDVDSSAVDTELESGAFGKRVVVTEQHIRPARKSVGDRLTAPWLLAGRQIVDRPRDPIPEQSRESQSALRKQDARPRRTTAEAVNGRSGWRMTPSRPSAP
ncbi:MAG: hypothetical protein EXQ81_06885 [Thermoleophilia bacterium]|nr:hypothetical protein [Thermoleophilia bacterium]